MGLDWMRQIGMGMGDGTIGTAVLLSLCGWMGDGKNLTQKKKKTKGGRKRREKSHKKFFFIPPSTTDDGKNKRAFKQKNTATQPANHLPHSWFRPRATKKMTVELVQNAPGQGPFIWPDPPEDLTPYVSSIPPFPSPLLPSTISNPKPPPPQKKTDGTNKPGTK